MKKIKSIMIALLPVLIMYLCYAFITTELDSSKWTYDERVLCFILTALAVGITMAVNYELNEKKDTNK